MTEGGNGMKMVVSCSLLVEMLVCGDMLIMTIVDGKKM
jgi:hypothetical protein